METQSRFKLKEVGIDEIVFVEKNARFMEQTTFLQLVDNIRRDGQLSSVPFTILLDNGKHKGKYEVISGNHRVKAAKQAGITRLHIMYVEEALISNDEKRAIQLSHNSITGQDDLGILRELVEEIANTDYKEYAHIDETIFEELDKFDYDIIQPKNEVVTVSLVFYDNIKADFDAIVEELDTFTEGDLENTHILPKAALQGFNEVVGMVQSKYRVKSQGMAVMKMVEIVKAQLAGDENAKSK
jgi:hypothetical protein